VAAIEAAFFIFYGSEFPVSLSVQQVIDCAGSGNCLEGGWPQSALEYAAGTALALSNDYAYKANKTYCTAQKVE
jgi:hypothetical protein